MGERDQLDSSAWATGLFDPGSGIDLGVKAIRFACLARPGRPVLKIQFSLVVFFSLSVLRKLLVNFLYRKKTGNRY